MHLQHQPPLLCQKPAMKMTHLTLLLQSCTPQENNIGLPQVKAFIHKYPRRPYVTRVAPTNVQPLVPAIFMSLSRVSAPSYQHTQLASHTRFAMRS